MAQNTAMQEAINKFDNLNPYQEFTAQEVVNILLELLPKERQDIISAWDDGKVTGCVIGSNDYTNETEDDNGTYYFTKNFNKQ